MSRPSKKSAISTKPDGQPFEGVLITFVKAPRLSSKRIEILKKHVEDLGGRVEESLSIKSTHLVVCKTAGPNEVEEFTSPQVNILVENHGHAGEWQIVNDDWLTESIKEKRPLPANEEYLAFSWGIDDEGEILLNPTRTLLQQTLTTLSLAHFPHSDTRKNVMREGVESLETMTLGLVNARQNGVVQSALTKTNRPLFNLLKEFLWKHTSTEDPRFAFTSITVSKNVCTGPHTDTDNIGPSWTISLGDFTAGELVCDSVKGIGGVKENTHNRWVKFDGTREHWTSPFTGTRYCLVYYAINRAREQRGDFIRCPWANDGSTREMSTAHTQEPSSIQPKQEEGEVVGSKQEEEGGLVVGLQCERAKKKQKTIIIVD